MRLRNKKTGEVMGLSMAGDIAWVGNYRYHSLAELNEHWEDYTIPEPLIKDSRACKIIRDWYEYHDTNLPIYCEDACTLSIDHSARIEFQERVFRNLEQDYRYAITELCGDEE